MKMPCGGFWSSKVSPGYLSYCKNCSQCIGCLPIQREHTTPTPKRMNCCNDEIRLYWGSYRDDHTSHLSQLSTLFSQLTVIIGNFFSLVSLHLHVLTQNFAKFHFITINNMVLSLFPKDQYAPLYFNNYDVLSSLEEIYESGDDY